MFKKILRTFEAEILKIFKNIQPQPKIRRSYKKRVYPKMMLLLNTKPAVLLICMFYKRPEFLG